MEKATLEKLVEAISIAGFEIVDIHKELLGEFAADSACRMVAETGCILKRIYPVKKIDLSKVIF